MDYQPVSIKILYNYPTAPLLPREESNHHPPPEYNPYYIYLDISFEPKTPKPQNGYPNFFFRPSCQRLLQSFPLFIRRRNDLHYFSHFRCDYFSFL